MVKRWPVWGLVGLSLTVLAAGLIATGGPAQGRAEKRDETRQRDLAELWQQLACKSVETGALLTDPTPTEACPATPRLADPFSETPYRVEQVDEQNLRLCAGFELPVDPQRNYGGRDAAGCVVQRFSLE